MLGVALIIAGSAIAAGEPGMIAGAIGPAVAGLVNLVVGRAMMQRHQPIPASSAQLSPEAKRYLQPLFREVVGWTGLRHQRRRAPYRDRPIGQPTRTQAAAQIVDASVFDHLDRAAHEANRVYGILEQIPLSDSDRVGLVARVRDATDQAMATVLHAAAQMDRYPEASALPVSTLQEQTRRLGQLADRLPGIGQSSSPAMEGLTALEAHPGGRLTQVLEELDLRNLADRELRADDAPSAVEVRSVK